MKSPKVLKDGYQKPQPQAIATQMANPKMRCVSLVRKRPFALLRFNFGMVNATVMAFLEVDLAVEQHQSEIPPVRGRRCLLGAPESPSIGDLTVPEELGLAYKAPQPELGYFGWYPRLVLLGAI